MDYVEPMLENAGSHLLPDNPMLYDEYSFLDFIAARTKPISQRLGSLFAEAIAMDNSEAGLIDEADDEQLITLSAAAAGNLFNAAVAEAEPQ